MASCGRLVIGLLLEVPNSNGEAIIRIISAREADPRECRIYLEQALD